MTLPFIDANEVTATLDMRGAINAMGDAMQAVSSGAVTMPPRTIVPIIDKSGFLGLMPGSASAPAVYGVKLVTLHPGNSAKGLPAIQGIVALFDHATGTPLAILDGAAITALRTAATSGLATDLLARTDVASHGVFGTGVQARTHFEAIRTVRPGITRTLIWGRDKAKAAALAAELASASGTQVHAANAEEVAACDVVSTVTSSATPILLGAWLRPGAHVNLVGSHAPDKREADGEAISRAHVFVDTRDGALREAGDLMLAIADGAFSADRIAGEIGAVGLGTLPGRDTVDQITLYKSLGVVAQDLFASFAVLKAKKLA